MTVTQAVYPFSIVEHHAFRTSVRKISDICGGNSTLLQFPSRATVRRYAKSIINEENQHELQMFYNTLDEKKWRAFAITNDSTTSCAKLHYTCLTGSIILKKPGGWELIEAYLKNFIRRAEKLLPYIRNMDTDKMWFKNEYKKMEWIDNLGLWNRESQYYMTYENNDEQELPDDFELDPTDFASDDDIVSNEGMEPLTKRKRGVLDDLEEALQVSSAGDMRMSVNS